MPANYDHIANVYDLLSRIIFGDQIRKAQVSLLKYIPADCRVLVVGGGTGWILEEIAQQHSTGLTIDYVELSEQMTGLSKKRNFRNNIVNFINLPIEDFAGSNLYEVIITPFLFDNFREDKIELIFRRLNALLKVDGWFLYADFVISKSESPLWQSILLKIMYFFFRVTCRIETRELVKMDRFFSNSYQLVDETSYYFKFIRAIAYQKKY